MSRDDFRKVRDENGEWWELFDESHKRFYYFNAKTKKSEWQKPDNALIIPMSVLQVYCTLMEKKAMKESSKSQMALNKTQPIVIAKPEGSQPSLPKKLQEEILQFQIDGFATKYFSTHRKGIFRRTVPLEKMVSWSKDLPNAPLLVLNKSLQKEALKCYKEILRIMGDKSGSISKTLKVANPLDHQYVLEKGICHGELRDEIYVQLCKQLTKNPNPKSVLKGWEFMSLLTVCFPPSKNFEDYLKTFIAQAKSSENGEESGKIEILKNYCAGKLNRICKTGPKGKTPTIAEIERGLKAPFSPSVFGETLEDIMAMNVHIETGGKHPKILTFLANAILKLNGCQTEGIFRVPGDADLITELKLRIENGEYDLKNITDPHVPASLLKFWLRDLADPLIPTDMYDRVL